MDNFDLRKYLIEHKNTVNSKLLEENSQAPAKPATQPVTKPGTTPKPTPRRRSVPSPSTSPTPAPKAMVKESEVMKKIIARYAKVLDRIDEADYSKIFDPETLAKLKGSVSSRIQGKNPMPIGMQMQKLAMDVMQLEKGNEDLLEQLAYDVVYEAYPYLKTNQDVIEIDAKIVPQAQVRDALQPNNPQEEDLDDLSEEEEAEMIEDAKKLGVKWEDFVAYRFGGAGDANYVIKGEGPDGKVYYVNRYGSGPGGSVKLYNKEFKQV